MKRMLLLLVCFILISSSAMADLIRVYSDADGATCVLASGFNTTATILHKFAVGTTGSRFKVTVPAGATVFAFDTPFTSVGNLNSDLAVDYGPCKTGTVVLGTIVAILTPGYVYVVPADHQADVLSRDCNLVERIATGGNSCVDCPPLTNTTYCSELATRPSTWGQVKSLYR